MNINRHNYEEFFLLYVDNELSAAERKTVEVFVQQNPDLQGELLLLQQTVLKTDDIGLEKKDWLFMEEGVSALQENLLLYGDNELSASDKNAIEALLASDKSANAEWNILQQIKLQPDTSLVFADKQSLYRTAGGKVVGFKWWRASAAAVLLGFGLWAGVAFYKKSFKATTGDTGLANGNKTNSGKAKTKIPENKNAVEPQLKETTAVQNNTTILVEKNQSVQPTENKVLPTEKISKQNTPEQKENIAAKNGNNKPANNLPGPYFENINRKPGNEKIVANVLPENNNNINVSGTNNVIVKTNPKENLTNPEIDNINKVTKEPVTNTAIQVVNKTNADGNNNYLDLDDKKGKRTKLGGFLRKAKRMLERTTNIKTGDGLKVAGFEIALK